MSPEVSIVVPAHNEEGCVEEIHRRVVQVLEQEGVSYEILFVDDGSVDRTFEILHILAAHDSHVRAIRLSRNFGHQAALSAGLAEARGRAVISMDCDLQHPPEVIPELLSRWREGAEVVITVREDTLGAGAGKRWTSRLFYRFVNALSPVPITAAAADFRLLDRKAVNALNAMPERTRFLRGLVPWIGFRQAEVRFRAPERFAGETQFSYRRMLSFALNGVLSLSAMPLRLATLVGGGIFGIGILYGIYVVLTALFNPASQPGWASIILAILLVGGVQIFFMGVIGEYLARVFDEVKGRPLYIIAESIGGEEREER